MARRRLLVTYDIADDGRRDRVFRLLRDHGDHVQYSVFLCELTGMERVQLFGRLEATINAAEDQILLLDLGAAEHDPTLTLSTIGRPFVPAERTLVV